MSSSGHGVLAEYVQGLLHWPQIVWRSCDSLRSAGGTCLCSWPLAGNDTSLWIRSQERNCLGIPGYVLRDQPPSSPSWSPSPAPQRGASLGYPIQMHGDSSTVTGMASCAQDPKPFFHHWHLDPGQVMSMYLEPHPSSDSDICCQVLGTRCQVLGTRRQGWILCSELTW